MSAKYNNILRVGEIILPDPSKMIVDDYDISESERNARGYIISQIIREDVHKLVCEWAMLRPEEYMAIRRAIKRKFDLRIFVFIPDENSGGELNMYAGDRRTPIYTYERGKPIYKGFTVNFIEM